MPLIPQQDIVTVSVTGTGSAAAAQALKDALAPYPPVRIVTIDLTPLPNPLGKGALGYTLMAVVETV